MKNKNRNQLKIYALLTLICFSYIITTSNKNITYNKNQTYSATYIIPTTLQELENNSPIIVKGYFNGNRKTDKDKNIVGPSSISQFEINQIIKGDIKESTIPVIEPCEIEKGNFSNIEGYIPMQQNQEYMLYLRPNNTDYGIQYSIVSMNFGKYNLSTDEGVYPNTKIIKDFNQISQQDFITQSQDICKIYNNIKSQITEKKISTQQHKTNILTNQNAFYDFRIIPSNNIGVFLDTKETNKFDNHTEAYNNAINKISNINKTNINIKEVDNTKSIINLSSTNSSKEEWIGIARITYDENTKPQPTFTKANVFINEYKIKSSNLTQDHTYQVALHELGHCFGLLHQDQLLHSQTLMVPYVLPSKPGVRDYYNIDKQNLTYAYPTFSDYKENWAKEQIDEFVEKEIIEGYPDSTFRPDKTMTRAEFVKTLNKAFGLTNTSNVEFEDTKGHWAKEQIDIAVTNNIAQGISSTQFKPDEPIKREEVAKMISSYKKIQNKEHTNLEKYTDSDQVSPWAKDYVEEIIKYGYMTGYPDNTFRPNKSITRAEAITTLQRALTK